MLEARGRLVLLTAALATQAGHCGFQMLVPSVTYMRCRIRSEPETLSSSAMPPTQGT